MRLCRSVHRGECSLVLLGGDAIIGELVDDAAEGRRIDLLTALDNHAASVIQVVNHGSRVAQLSNQGLHLGMVLGGGNHH